MKRKMMAAMIVALGTAAAQAEGPARQEAAGQDTPFGGASRVESAELARATGSADLAMVIDAKNTSNVSNNTVGNGAVTGGISFDQAALSNLSGLSVLSANTGNNVAINSSLNLNVAIHP